MYCASQFLNFNLLRNSILKGEILAVPSQFAIDFREPGLLLKYFQQEQCKKEGIN